MNRNFLLRACNIPILFLLCLSACARLPTAPVAGEKPAIQSAPDLVKQLEARAAEIQSLKGKGNVSVVSPQKNYTGNALITEIKPAVLRVDVLNFWGQPVIAFLMNDQEIKLLVYPESKLYRGPANSTNLSRFIPLPVTVQRFYGPAYRVAWLLASMRNRCCWQARTRISLNLELTSVKGNERVNSYH